MLVELKISCVPSRISFLCAYRRLVLSSMFDVGCDLPHTTDLALAAGGFEDLGEKHHRAVPASAVGETAAVLGGCGMLGGAT
jgi:hypothetical protein